jgi:hypothetical protein
MSLVVNPESVMARRSRAYQTKTMRSSPAQARPG